MPPPSSASEAEPARPLLALAFGAALLLASLVPFALGAAWAPDGTRFRGTRPINAPDLAANLARIERVRAGDLLLKNPYTAELGNVGLLRPTYLVTGWLARATGCSARAALHLMRVLLGALAVLAIYRLLADLLPTERGRWGALVLCCLGSGLSWLSWVSHPTAMALVSFWPDATQPECNVYASLLEPPHFALALALLAEAVRAARRALAPAEPRWGRALAVACGATVVLLLDRPFDAPTLAVLTAILLAVAWRRGLPARRLTAVAGALLLAAALPAALLAATLLGDPTADRWRAANVLPSPSPAAYVLAYGVTWVLALLGARRLLRAGHPDRVLLVAWAALPWLLTSLPFSFQRRLVEGWPIPLAALAAVWLGAQRRRLAVPALALCCLGTAFLVGYDLVHYGVGKGPDYVATERWEGLAWAAERAGPEQVVLAAREASLWIPTHAACRVVHGHAHQGALAPAALAAICRALREAEATRAPPRFTGPLAGRVRFVVALRAAPGEPALLRLGEETFRPTWAPPAFANGQVEVFEVAPSRGGRGPAGD